MAPMSPDEITSQLNDPFAVTVLRKNAGGKGVWPATVPDIVTTVVKANPTFVQKNYMVGEGCQIPTSIAPREGTNRDLRYVLDWGPSGNSPVIFLSAFPPGVPNGTPPPFLQVISWDAKKSAYNYYQYVSNNSLDQNVSDNTPTWSWAGDSTYARKPATKYKGCFDCHLNGAVIMKELTAPWNNWQSQLGTIDPGVVPAAVAADPIFQNLTGAQTFQQDIQGGVFQYTSKWVQKSVQNGNINAPSELLRRLILTTNVNFASTQTLSAMTQNVTALPKDFFLYDSLLNGVLNLTYAVPQLNLNRSGYNQFMTSNQFVLVNSNPPGAYQQQGDTYFAFFVPVPAYEDTKAIQQLISQKIVSKHFVAAILMVDFQNPVFSAKRSKLMQYALQIGSARIAPDQKDIPTQFAAFVSAAAANQPPCDTTHLDQCTAEQQFLYYWKLPEDNSKGNWETACQNMLNGYLTAIGSRITTPAGLNDYMTLSVSRRTQFATYPPINNLKEFSLLLPQTSLGTALFEMHTDGTIGSIPTSNKLINN